MGRNVWLEFGERAADVSRQIRDGPVHGPTPKIRKHILNSEPTSPNLQYLKPTCPTELVAMLCQRMP